MKKNDFDKMVEQTTRSLNLELRTEMNCMSQHDKDLISNFIQVAADNAYAMGFEDGQNEPLNK